MRQGLPANLAALMILTGCTSAPHKAALRGDSDAVLALAGGAGGLEACGKADWVSTGMTTPLGIAASAGQDETVRALLAKGADPEARHCGYFSPLWLAAGRGTPEAIRLLVEAGADVNRNNHRYTGSLLHLIDDVETARLLVEHGVDTTQIFHGAHGTDWTPAAYARHRGLPELARFLEEVSSPEGRARLAREKASRQCGPELRVAEHQGDTAAKKGRALQALQSYAQALGACPESHESKGRLFTKLLDTVRLMSPAPPLPQKALDHASRAEAFVKLARGSHDFANAAAEYQKALEAAPWWPEAYFNQGLAREKAGDPAGATQSLKRFLLAAPDAPEAADVRQRIVELEVATEMRSGKR